ncbi:MAG: NAD-dependent epimerase/dehydratase family protein [Candidatus Woesearchaeota archaeon]
MKALVIGGAGFIGSHTVDALIERGYDVRILDSLSMPVHAKGKPKYINKKAEFVYGNINDESTLEKCMKDVSIIFNFAAFQDYLPFFSKFFETNCLGNSLIYEIAVRNKFDIQKIIIASSQFVNGEGCYIDKNGRKYFPEMRDEKNLMNGIWDHLDEKGKPLKWQWTAEDHFSPPNQYAISKFAQEIMSINFGKRYNIPTTCLRYSIVQGERQSFYNMYSGAMRIFSMNYMFNKSPIIFEDGEMLRDFVNIHDVIDANLLVLEKTESDFHTYNIGGGKAISLKSFCIKVAKEFNKLEYPLNIPGVYRFGDTRNACSDISKINKLGWSPKRSIEYSIKSYKEYLEKSKLDISFLEKSLEKMKKLNIIRNIK